MKQAQIIKEQLEIQYQKILKFHEVRKFCSGEFFQPIIWEGDSRYLNNFNNHSVINGKLHSSLQLNLACQTVRMQ
jgi:hypothetical protein